MAVIAAARPGGAPSLVARISRNPWTGFLFRRLLSLAIILLALAFATFSMVRLIPGDPALNIAGIGATPEQLDAIHHQLGIDQPLLVQLVTYFNNLLHGDLGSSFVTKQPVTQVIQT